MRCLLGIIVVILSAPVLSAQTTRSMRTGHVELVHPFPPQNEYHKQVAAVS
jgi:hypothetical protein